MNVSTTSLVVPAVSNGVYDPDELFYPDSDGKPMAHNTIQYRWIVTLQGNLNALFKNDPAVFVSGDLLWYPIEGDNTTRQTPDVMVVFGRPKGDRGSYKQWQEADIAPQVVFEILSPGNRVGEMARTFDFYDRFGVAEYYLYDPKDGDLSIWQRGTGDSGDGEDRLRVADWEDEWTSSRLGVRFVPHRNAELEIFHPDGRRFLTFQELDDALELAVAQSDQAQAERDIAMERAERLAARLQALGIDPDTEEE